MKKLFGCVFWWVISGILVLGLTWAMTWWTLEADWLIDDPYSVEYLMSSKFEWYFASFNDVIFSHCQKNSFGYPMNKYRANIYKTDNFAMCYSIYNKSALPALVNFFVASTKKDDNGDVVCGDKTSLAPFSGVVISGSNRPYALAPGESKEIYSFFDFSSSVSNSLTWCGMLEMYRPDGYIDPDAPNRWPFTMNPVRWHSFQFTLEDHISFAEDGLTLLRRDGIVSGKNFLNHASYHVGKDNNNHVRLRFSVHNSNNIPLSLTLDAWWSYSYGLEDTGVQQQVHIDPDAYHFFDMDLWTLKRYQQGIHTLNVLIDVKPEWMEKVVNDWDPLQDWLWWYHQEYHKSLLIFPWPLYLVVFIAVLIYNLYARFPRQKK